MPLHYIVNISDPQFFPNPKPTHTMPNMSYCRFQNTKYDLKDCLDNLWNISSMDEAKARKRLIAIAKDIIAEYESDPVTIDELKFDGDDDDEESTDQE